LLNAQVMLDRAGFSPGVIDGRYGENVRQALAAFQEARGLPASGTLDQTTWLALQAVGGPPPVARYVLTQADIAGPFIAGVPEKLEEKANLQALSYTSTAELIAERFHMDEDLLRALNPNEAFLGAGTEIMVANPARPALTAQVARIEVDADERAVRAYDAAGTLLAFYPATIGSTEQPSPTGSMTVNGVSRNPTFTYDPKKLDYRPETKRRLTVAAGPNNPVGLVWIDLSKPTYGIHGAPDPDVIGKTQSNGCVRLTNWDVQALALAVKPGVKVTFV
jgi:lipoprotein-anchoring transpeptidase ErfK/SrfK